MDRLIEARIAAGVTQSDLSVLLQRPQSFVSKYESGERRLDAVELLEVLDALKVPHDTFIMSLTE